MKHEEVQGYTIFRSVWEALQSLDDPLIRLEIREALDHYAFTGSWNLDSLSPVGKMFLTLQKPVIDSNLSRIAQGRKGGMAKKKAPLEKINKGACSKSESLLPRDKDEDEAQVQNENKNEGEGQENRPSGSLPSSSSSSSLIEKSALDFYLEQGRKVTDKEKTELHQFEKKLGRDVVKRAIDIVLSEKKPFSYLRGILSNKVADGVTSLALWDEVEERKFGIRTSNTSSMKSETNYYDGMTKEEEAFWREKNNDYSSSGSG